MKTDHSSSKSNLMRAFFLVALLCAVPASAQEQSAAPGQDATKAITGTVTNVESQGLANAKVLIEPACDCQPCKNRGVSCSICCPPGYVAPLVEATADASGSFNLDTSKLSPGLYSLKVLSGRFSRSITFKIEDKNKQLEFQFAKPSDIKVDLETQFANVKIPVNTRMG